MKILWITNILFPEAEQLLTGSGEFKTSGGWMLGLANSLLQKDDIDLCIASISPKVRKLTKLIGHKIIYYILPVGKGQLKVNMEYGKYWKTISEDIKPDVVHIHGTEYSHGHAYMKTCGTDNVVISIQGMTSAYSHYYHYGMAMIDIIRNLTFHDFVKGSILSDKRDFAQRGKYEIEMIKMSKHIIGRTSWDKARTWAINSDARYHFCNEILRSDFYSGEIWHYDRCKKHSIFLSQAGYPIKGLHQLIKAMPLILRHYPDTQIRIAGNDITKSKTLIEKLRFSGYGRYIKYLIKKYHLESRVAFTGNLNAIQMKQEYLNANIFICPSTIENSPNSLGEAQILGTPCLSSYVGGAMDMMAGNEENLYRFDEIEMLAYKVCNIFARRDDQSDMRAIAATRHNPNTNVNQLLHIYKQIIQS